MREKARKFGTHKSLEVHSMILDSFDPLLLCKTDEEDPLANFLEATGLSDNKNTNENKKSNV